MELFSLSISGPNASAFMSERGSGQQPNVHLRTSACAVRCQAELKPSKLHLLTRPQQSDESAPRTDIGTAEPASRCIFLSAYTCLCISACAVRCQAELKLNKLHLLNRPYHSDESAPRTDLGIAELASRFIFLSAYTFKDDFRVTSALSNLLFLSHNIPKYQESLERDDFYANMGSAIRILREETPFLFYKDLNYSIYRDDITFRDPRNTFAGIDKYKLIFWALRFHGQMFFKAIWVEVLRIWQPSDRVIVIRWTVRGIPRVPWEAQGIFEGTSKYKLDQNGKIYEHKVDNVAPSNPSYYRTPPLLNLLPSSTCATPTPTMCRTATLPLFLDLITARGSTWERFYRALTTTLDMHQWWILYLAS